MTYESSECLFCFNPTEDDFCSAACREAWWIDGNETVGTSWN